MKGSTGTSLRTHETPERRRRRRRRREHEEREWAARSGPVVSYVDESVRRDRQAPIES